MTANRASVCQVSMFSPVERGFGKKIESYLNSLNASMEYAKNRIVDCKIHRLFYAVLALSICAGSMRGAESTEVDGRQYDRLMSQHPAPELPTGTWQAIVSRVDASRGELRSWLHVVVVEGRIRSAEVRKTTIFFRQDESGGVQVSVYFKFDRPVNRGW